MKHTIYVIIEDGLVSAVLANNGTFKNSEITTCVIHHGQEDNNDNGDMRNNVADFIQETDALTNTSIYYPSYDDIEINIMQQLENEL